MNSDCSLAPASITTKSLAVLSLAAFWAIPLSPFVAIAALARTRGRSDWPRKFAIAGAFLANLWVVAAFLWLTALTLSLDMWQ